MYRLVPMLDVRSEGSPDICKLPLNVTSAVVKSVV